MSVLDSILNRLFGRQVVNIIQQGVTVFHCRSTNAWAIFSSHRNCEHESN